MIEDVEGFLIPEVNLSICVDCGLCEQVCPLLQDIRPNNYDKKILAIKLKDKKLIMNSASGGAFVGIAKEFILNGGVVFGCTFNKELKVSHIAINNIEKLFLLQGSKYVQSNTEGTYAEAKKYLDLGLNVLYTGTPCQIAGIMCFLGEKYENLYTIELICHGVPSPKLFNNYLIWLSKKYHNGPIQEYAFRSKEANGWGLTYKFKLNTKTKTKISSVDPYYNAFLKGYTYRECCYKCKFAKNRVGDITIGDYWGIEEEHPNFFDSKGVSAVIINSRKGKKLIDSVFDKFDILESTYDKVSRHNKNLIEPTNRPKERDNIYNDINYISVEEYFNKRMSKFISLKSKIGTLIPTGIKKKIGRVIG